jgi:ABC-type bacteriocin/lantibiotic exporter with double-glycine peptidase domain
VRAQSFFFLSRPSIYLVASVISTCIGASFIAVYASDLHWLSVAWIALFDLGMLVISDLLKIWVHGLIDDSPGDVITSDELLEVAPIEKTDIETHMKKKLRYVVYSESVLPVEDRQHPVASE